MQAHALPIGETELDVRAVAQARFEGGPPCTRERVGLHILQIEQFAGGGRTRVREMRTRLHVHVGAMGERPRDEIVAIDTGKARLDPLR